MAKTQPKDRRFFTTTEVARYCEVSNDGVLKWIKAGKLEAFATPGGHYRISVEDFREFLTLYAFPIQESFFGTVEDAPHLKRVLVVDDEADQREILMRSLHKIDPSWLLDEAGDGYEAGIKIGMIRPDLVVLDLMMPHIDGLSLCRSITPTRTQLRFASWWSAGTLASRRARERERPGPTCTFPNRSVLNDYVGRYCCCSADRCRTAPNLSNRFDNR